MIELTDDERELLSDEWTFRDVLELYEPSPRINAFCPQLNEQRIAELKQALNVPSPAEYRQAVNVIKRYHAVIKNNHAHELACEIGGALRLNSTDTLLIEKILKNEVSKK